MSTTNDVRSWLDRLDTVERRLRRVAAPLNGLTGADPHTGEQWEAGQVWGHLAEFIQFWTEQAGDVIDEFGGAAVPYGRKSDDPSRMTGIEEGLDTPIETLWEEVRSDLSDLKAFLHALPEGWDRAVGLHYRTGEVPVTDIIERTLIGHLEEHAAQLEGLLTQQG
ncbi:MAG: DinB family protein [Actinomycetota bacterium]